MAALNSANRDPARSTYPTSCSWTGRTTSTCPSASDRTSASARSWPGSSCRSPCWPWLRRFPKMSLAKPAEELEWRRVLVSGLAELPVNLGTERACVRRNVGYRPHFFGRNNSVLRRQTRSCSVSYCSMKRLGHRLAAADRARRASSRYARDLPASRTACSTRASGASPGRSARGRPSASATLAAGSAFDRLDDCESRRPIDAGGCGSGGSPRRDDAAAVLHHRRGLSARRGAARSFAHRRRLDGLRDRSVVTTCSASSSTTTRPRRPTRRCCGRRQVVDGHQLTGLPRPRRPRRGCARHRRPAQLLRLRLLALDHPDRCAQVVAVLGRRLRSGGGEIARSACW